MRVLRFPIEEGDARMEDFEDRIATYVADRERAERAARGEVDLDVALEEDRIAKEALEPSDG